MSAIMPHWDVLLQPKWGASPPKGTSSSSMAHHHPCSLLHNTHSGTPMSARVFRLVPRRSDPGRGTQLQPTAVRRLLFVDSRFWKEFPGGLDCWGNDSDCIWAWRPYLKAIRFLGNDSDGNTGDHGVNFATSELGSTVKLVRIVYG